MKRIISILIIVFFGVQAVTAQEVSGKIFGRGENNKKTVLPGANIYWAKSLKGTTSDIQGRFSITLEHEHHHEEADGDHHHSHDDHLLVFSFVGYTNDTIHVHHDMKNVEIVLSAISELEGVEVTAREVGTFVSRIDPIVTQQINRAELHKAACCNLSESFETNATVDVSYSDAVTGAKQIQMLGLAGIYSQMLTENIPNFNGLANSYGLMWVPGTWMESIQVSKGTAAVINGYESITGQINVEYKKPDDSEKLFLNLFVDNEGRFESNMNAATEVNPNWSTMIYGHFSSNNTKNDHNNDGFLDHPLYSQYNFFNRWKYVGQKHEAQFGVHYINEDRTGGQVDFEKGGERLTTNPYGIGIKNERVQAFAKNGVLLNREASSVAMINSFTRHEQDAFFGLRDYSARQNSFYNNLIYQSWIGNTKHNFSTGASYLYNEYNEMLSDSAFSLKESVPGLFFQYTYSNPEKLTFIAGMRADFHNLFGTFYTPRFHVRYALTENTIVRASAGKGYRTANVIAENISLLAGSRRIIASEKPQQEEAWNYGIHFTQYFTILGKELSLSADFYRTEFKNQVIVDMDSDVREIRIYNLNGRSYSNSMQVEASYELLPRLDVLAAFRINDVKMTINDELLQKPLISKYKGLITLSYATNMNRWQFDFTSQFNGGGRIPTTVANPQEYRRPETFEPYTIINSQITRYFRKWSIYVGGENLLNYTQDNPVIAADQPFSEYFDASLVYGPLMGTKIYAGLRFTID